MKQLKKVQLQDAKELTNSQMKDITGGSTPTSGCDVHATKCNGDCSHEGFDGVCTSVSYGGASLCACVAP